MRYDIKTLYASYEEYIRETMDKYGIPNDLLIKKDQWCSQILAPLDIVPYRPCLIYEFSNLNPGVRLEYKFYILRMLETHTWQANSYIDNYKKPLHLLEKFLNEYYPEINSVLEPREKDFVEAWHEHVRIAYPERVSKEFILLGGEIGTYHSITYKILENMIKTLREWTESRKDDEWERDIWSINALSKYGISYVKSTDHKRLDFNYVGNESFRKTLKRYMKESLLRGRNFTWGTATTYFYVINHFLDFYSMCYPERNDFTELSKEDINKYFEFLVSSKKNLKNPARYVAYNAWIIRTFLTYIQLEEFKEAPKIRTERLIRYEELPYSNWHDDFNEEKYVPEYVVCQLLRYGDKLPEQTKLVVLIMLNTGFRISDTLEISFDALKYHEDNYWIEIPIIKTKKNMVRIPISDELAELIKERVEYIQKRYGDKHNPHHLLFISDRKRDGLPISQKIVLKHLNRLAYMANICDQNGKLYHFKNQAFRHTFAVNCLNNGMDIITLQEFLGHSSPEMTLVYAKLLDSTKKKVFKEVMSSEIFSFKNNNMLEKEDMSDLSPEVLERFWIKFKINAIDTPYGTCMQRLEGKCKFAAQPPCLTCRGGEPCKDLCIGANPMDVAKYDILIRSTESMVQLAQLNNKEEMVEENQKLLSLYRGIHEKICYGGIIYGRPDRIRRIEMEDSDEQG